MTGTVFPDADTAARARAAVRSLGLRPAAARLGLPRSTLLAAAAEAPMHFGTVLAVRRALDAQGPADPGGEAA